MRVAVTGAEGFLGRGVVKELLDRGADVVAACFAVPDGVDARAVSLVGDVFAYDDPHEALGKPDVVLHLAWLDGFAHNSDEHMKNLYKHCKFVDALAASPLKRLAIMGSMHEVGYHEGAVHPDTPCFPMSKYGIAKNALRDYSKLACSGGSTKWQWLRGYYIVSADPRGSSIFSKIAQAAEEGKTTFPFTSGVNEYDYLDYGEFCRQVALAVMQDSVCGIIDICSGKGESLSSRVERFIEDEGLEVELEYGAFPDRPYDSPGIWGDSAAIGKVLATAEKEGWD